MEKSFTTYEIAQFCEVTMRAVTQWIDHGKLPAYRTPGGHRRVKLSNFLAFLKQFQMPIPPSLESGSKVRILIVDDDKSMVGVMKRALTKFGEKVEIDVAIDGFEAGQKVMSFYPDLVLLDLKLPGIDGFSVCQKIKDQKEKEIKVLVVTGYSSADVRKKALGCGADGFLEKPFKLPEFLDEVARLLGIIHVL